MTLKGKIIKIAGPVVVAENMRGVQMYEVVRVGEERLIGEVIELKGDNAVIQVYEETSGIASGDIVESTGAPLSAILGPGLIGNIYDGILRPLHILREKDGDFLKRGAEVASIDMEKKWEFKPLVRDGDSVCGGEIIGTVKETGVIEHRIMVPPDIKKARVEHIVAEGIYSVDTVVCELVEDDAERKREVRMYQQWAVRRGRPYKRKLDPVIPLVTGQRILDTFFPMAKGGTGAIPGGFGTGKTVTQQQLAKWADADIIVYIGCGERGNEMTEVLDTFPNLKDPRTGKSLMERSIIIANTSNMPVAAREASVYTGMTLAEYYRDQGYSVAIMADSTSRWAEAMREISGRLEEMPGEEGYPAYLTSRLAEFYERAGRVETLSGREGSVTVVGAVSPPGGDFSEPVTQGTLRVTKVFWALDKSLASRRHFPAINWLDSYSLYLDSVTEWYCKKTSDDWRDLRDKAMALLQKEQELREIVQLVGPDSLPPGERIVLDVARMLREDFLQQNAYHDQDSFCPVNKQYLMLKIILHYEMLARKALENNVSLEKILSTRVKSVIARLKEQNNDTFHETYEKTIEAMEKEFEMLEAEIR